MEYKGWPQNDRLKLFDENTVTQIFITVWSNNSLCNATYAVLRPNFTTLLPSNRKSSGSNFFPFLLNLWTAGFFLTIIFVVWVIFPGISFKTEIPHIHLLGLEIALATLLRCLWAIIIHQQYRNHLRNKKSLVVWQKVLTTLSIYNSLLHRISKHLLPLVTHYICPKVPRHPV